MSLPPFSASRGRLQRAGMPPPLLGERPGHSNARRSVPWLPPYIWRAIAAPQVTSDTAMRPSRFRVRQKVVPITGAAQSVLRGRDHHRRNELERSPLGGGYAIDSAFVVGGDREGLHNFHARWCAARA